jgi:hypothetical protein
LQPNACDGIATGDLAATTTKGADRTKKIVLTFFFTSRKLNALEALPKRTTFTGNYFISDILPDLDSEKLRYCGKNPEQEFFLHMDNSKCHNAKKITGKLQKKQMTRAPHPPDSPDLSPCDFCFFGMVKEKNKDREFCSGQEIVRSLSDAWRN